MRNKRVPHYKPLHDAWRDNYVARSTLFVACMFLGQGRYDKRAAPTLREARRIKQQMLKEYGDTNARRGVLIYAITPDNLSILVEGGY